MPTDVSWLYRPRIASVRFYGILELEDIQEQMRQTENLFAEAEAPLHFFIDTSGIEKYNLSLAQIRSAFPAHNPKAGWTVVYGPSGVTRFFASIIMQLVKGSYHFVDSQKAAVEFIPRSDTSLQDLQIKLPVD